MGKSIKPKADPAADTVTSPNVPRLDDGSAPRAVGTIEDPSRQAPGDHSSERLISSDDSEGRGQCLARPEVVAYLGPACPKDVRVRVDTHISVCAACRRWVRHVDDEILEYVGGQRSEEELARMDAHLDACNSCRDLMHHVLQGMAKSWHGEGRDTPDADTTFAPGNVVNSRYLIRSFVGRGGMGEVYEAFDRLMDRRIALKTVLLTVADRPRAARRFKEEVRNAQRVGHPHVCRINDLQEHHEAIFGPPLPFFTMEFIDGERLGNVLQENVLPLDDVRAIALQLLDGLRAAHERGVLHLDFKSDNVMLRRNTSKPDAVIMDFGLSRVLGNESRLRTSDRRQFAGTLPYMSVEQLECREDLGPATDVYGFGVVLYEMLTRTLPFMGESLSAVLLKQLNERPKPPSRHTPGLSPALDRFVLKCLSNHPRQRYVDAGEALRALSAIGSWTGPPRALERLRKVAVPAGVLGVIMGLIVAASFAGKTGPSAPTAPPESNAPTVERRTQGLAPTPDAPQPANAAPAVGEAPPAAQPAPEPPTPEPPSLEVPSLEGPPVDLASLPSTKKVARDVRRPAAEAAQPVQATPPVGAPESPPASLVDREPAPTRAPASASPAAGADDAAWKPTRVPKRLAAPSKAPASDSR